MADKSDDMVNAQTYEAGESLTSYESYEASQSKLFTPRFKKGKPEISRFGGRRFQIPRPPGVEQTQQLPGPGLHLGRGRRLFVAITQQM
jgi:hypothetical protein